ncbi:helix-turn-helix domain-containing protein [Veillonella magna]|uniref:helix-turn-helix domain-containing protein n=1 Tax=Veillonella magna TaxID=464322 RepID=UPI0023F234BF|nr:helix-turn-helix transcriptional regulator [Veillonella magna]
MPRNSLTEFEKNIRKQISENLKKRTSNITQNELSRMTGIPASTLSGYFAMRSTPNAGNIQKLALALNCKKSDIDPRFSSLDNFQAKEPLPKLTQRDEAQIAKDLEKMLSDLDNNTEFAAHGGTVEDEEDRELLRSSLLTTMKLAKQIAKKKFTPKKYRE